MVGIQSRAFIKGFEDAPEELNLPWDKILPIVGRHQDHELCVPVAPFTKTSTPEPCSKKLKKEVISVASIKRSLWQSRKSIADGLRRQPNGRGQNINERIWVVKIRSI